MRVIPQHVFVHGKGNRPEYILAIDSSDNESVVRATLGYHGPICSIISSDCDSRVGGENKQNGEDVVENLRKKSEVHNDGSSEPDIYNQIFATGGADTSVRLWSVGRDMKFVLVRELNDHVSGCVTAVRFHRDLLASGGDDGHVMIWSIDKSKTPVEEGDVILSKNDILAKGCRLNETTEKAYTDEVSVCGIRFGGLDSARDNDRVSNKDNINDNYEASSHSPEEPAYFTAATAPGDQPVELTYRWNSRPKRLLCMDEVVDIAWTQNGDHIVVALHREVCLVWHVHTAKPKQRLDGHGGRVMGIAVDPLNKFIITISADRRMRVWSRNKAGSFRMKHAVSHWNDDVMNEGNCGATDMDTGNDDCGSSIKSIQDDFKRRSNLFIGELHYSLDVTAYFSRRPPFSRAGALCICPGGITPGGEFCSLVFCRTDYFLSPVAYIPSGLAPSTCVRFIDFNSKDGDIIENNDKDKETLVSNHCGLETDEIKLTGDTDMVDNFRTTGENDGNPGIEEGGIFNGTHEGGTCKLMDDFPNNQHVAVPSEFISRNRIIESHGEEINFVEKTPTKIVASNTKERAEIFSISTAHGNLLIFDIRSFRGGKLLPIFAFSELHCMSILDVCFSNDGKFLACASTDGFITLLNIEKIHSEQ